MGLRDILKKKDDIEADSGLAPAPAPEFVFIRSDTANHEVIQPPGAPTGYDDRLNVAGEPSLARRSLDVFRSRGSGSRSRSASVSSQVSNQGEGDSKDGRRRGSRRLSDVLHLKREAESSEHVPQNLPEIVLPADPADADGTESQWEKRATMLAGQNERAASRPSSRHSSRPGSRHSNTGGGGVSNERLLAMKLEQASLYSSDSPSSPGARPENVRTVSSQQIDQDIQEAIRLHEEGDLVASTRLFGRLADPHGANNPLSQVLYGLALRHGWGCEPNPTEAVRHLTAAASNAASVEQLALQAGLNKGGAAKGELILAIFELANCFRNGWGIEKDPFAAKQYYETAANLGDTDAMNEVAWCYLEGFGCKKDKFASARYYRLAEKAGNKTLGNTWIWKEKYDPPGEGGSSSKKK